MGVCVQVVNQEDPNWWQAKHVDDVEGTAGLIPSQSLEERRKAFNKTDFDQISYSSALFSLLLSSLFVLIRVRVRLCI